MHAGALRGADDLVRVHLAKAGDVFGNGAFKQLDILRQVANPRAQLVFVPLEDVGAVQAHLARLGRPHAHQQTRQGGFARSGRANHAHHIACAHGKGQAAHHCVLAARRHGDHAFHRHIAGRGRQRHAGAARRGFFEQIVQTGVRGARAQQLLPGANRQLHRLQRLTHQDRAGDHHAGGQLAFDHQQGAQAQNQRLQADADELGHHIDAGVAVRGQGLVVQNAAVIAKPALADGRQHAHGFDHFGIAQIVVGESRRGHGRLVGVGQRLAGGHFGQVSQAKQQQRADQHHQPQQRVEHEAHQQINRHPRRIKEGEQAIAGQKLTHTGQIVNGLRRVAASALEVAFKRSGEHALVKLHVQAIAHADQHRRARQLQQLHQRVQAQRHQREHQQRGFVAAGQHAVIDLQHVNGRHQPQQVDDKAECAQLVKGFTEAVQRFGQLRAGCQMFFHECVKRGMNQGGTPAPDGCAVRKAHAQGNSPQRRAVYHARIATVCNGL